MNLSLEAARNQEPAYVVRALQAEAAWHFRDFPDEYQKMQRTIDTFDGLVRLDVDSAWREHRAATPWYRRWKLGASPDQRFKMNLYDTWRARLMELYSQGGYTK